METVGFNWTDAPSHSAGYLEATVLQLVAEVRPETVLDAGCGMGAMAAALARQGYAVTGFDADAGGIGIAQAKFPSVTFRVGSFADQPAETFDVVVSTEVIEHLYAPEDLASFAWASLRPGGSLIISTPYHGYLKNLALSLFDKWDHHHTPLWQGGHIKFFSRKTLTRLLEKQGFTVTRFIGAGRYPFLWKSMVLVAKRQG